MDGGLPRDLFFMTFSRLSIKDLLRCRLLNKTWFTIVSDPSFSSFYFSREPPDVILSMICKTSYILSENSQNIDRSAIKPMNLASLPFITCNSTILNTCNGLICISDFIYRKDGSSLPHNSIHVYNPLTNEHLQLPDYVIETKHNCFMKCVHGFGFDAAKEEFKLVLVLFHIGRKSTKIVKKKVVVFVLGSNAWRKRVCDAPNILSETIRETSSLAFVNGSLHWVGLEETRCHGGKCIGFRPVIMSFHVGREEFGIVPVLDSLELSCLMFYHSGSFAELGVVKGCRWLADSPTITQTELWVMQDYNVKESWVKRYILTRFGIAWPLCFLEDDNVILLVHDSNFKLYNTANGKYTCLNFHDSRFCTKVFPVMKSLISPRYNQFLKLQ